MTIRRSEVREGDVLVNSEGRPFAEVTRVCHARARGYLIFIVRNLITGFVYQISGHRVNSVEVSR